MSSLFEQGIGELQLKTALSKYWGYSDFKEGQLEICLNILKVTIMTI
jgi:hypothetical protein